MTIRIMRRSQGGALFPVVLTTFLIVTLGSAVLSTMLRGLHASRRLEQGTLAFNVAESGVERGARWLEDQPYPPAGTATLTPFGTNQALGAGTYTVQVVPDSNNNNAILKAYKIVSTGTIYGQSERVEMYLRQQSFGRYAYFTDSETSSVSGGRIWFFRGDKIRGPAHSNNSGGSNFQIDWQNSTAPIFEDIVTAVGNSMNYNPSNPTTESQFLKIYKDGSRGYRLGVDRIPMPSSSDIQRDAAWGANSSFPGTNGVYVPANGGIYVRGDSNITMTVESGNQVFSIVQGSTTTKVTVNLAANTRTVKVGSGSPTTVAGSGTGVLFSTGNINALSGTIANNIVSGGTITKRNAYTIAADVVNGKNIVIPNPIKYASTPDPSLPLSHATNLTPGTLGLIARNVTVDTGAPTNMEIDAIILAGGETVANGSFGVEDYNTKSPTGTLKLIGGVIQKARGAVGTISNGSIQTGYAKDYYYDPRLADYPPPYFPTTGKYDTLSWKKYRGTL